MVYSGVILQLIRDIRLNGRYVLTIQNQTRASKNFKCTIFAGYGGGVFGVRRRGIFTGVGVRRRGIFTGVAPYISIIAHPVCWLTVGEYGSILVSHSLFGS